MAMSRKEDGISVNMTEKKAIPSEYNLSSGRDQRKEDQIDDKDLLPEIIEE